MRRRGEHGGPSTFDHHKKEVLNSMIESRRQGSNLMLSPLQQQMLCYLTPIDWWSISREGQEVVLDENDDDEGQGTTMLNTQPGISEWMPNEEGLRTVPLIETLTLREPRDSLTFREPFVREQERPLRYFNAVLWGPNDERC